MDATQDKYNALFEAMCSMRHHQIQSEKFRCSDDRAKYLRWQRKVDELLKAEMKERKSLQAKIF